MRRSALIVAVAAVVLIVGGVTAAIALSGDDLPDVPVTQDEAVAAATAAVPGDVVEVELERENGIVGYEVEIRTSDGSVFEVNVDPETGEVLGQGLDDDVPGEPDDDGPDDDDD